MSQPKLATPVSGYGGRGYRIPGRLDEAGKQIVYPSVTTVLKMVAKPAIDQWIADQTAAYAVANISKLMERDEEIGFGFLRWHWNKAEPDPDDELRMRYAHVLSDAAELGTNLHEFIEAETGDAPFPTVDSARTGEMVDAWDEWLLHHDVVAHRNEFTCVNDTWAIAGTADGDWTITCLHDEPCLGTFEPVRTLIDVKTARSTWPEHRMQVAALRSAEVVMREVNAWDTVEGDKPLKHTVKGVTDWWVEEAPPKWERTALLHIRPDDLDSKGDKIPRFCKLIQVDDLDLYTQGFLGALNIVRMNRGIKEREHARLKETEK